jgi:hypothetical protein
MTDEPTPMSPEQYREEISRRLDEARPDRYHEDDRDWMEPVVDWAEENMPPSLLERILEEAEEDDG